MPAMVLGRLARTAVRPMFTRATLGCWTPWGPMLPRHGLQVVPLALGDDAGLIGAACSRTNRAVS
ncbi:MAG: hypothetical protein QOK15_1257 [Nocardioidaceae bacterium]|jgi:hypothetical protein|nr:hypothetical protein [Nocardioidaceae bacterium]